MKIGLVAGGGALPHSVIAGAKEAAVPLVTAVLDGFADPAAFPDETSVFGLAELGKITKYFKNSGCTHVCFAGYVKRPDFSKLRPDFKGLLKLPGAVKAAKNGDDSLLSFILDVFEKDGFEIVSPQEICKDLLMPVGNLGDVKLRAEHRADVEKACKVASAIGALDIGQGAVVCRGVVLAVEAQEGTDSMLRRVAALSSDIRGSHSKPEGILAKLVKPGQEERVDLPVIGVTTVELASEAGLAGIAVEAGRAFVLDKDRLVEAANAAGIFVVGIPPAKA